MKWNHNHWRQATQLDFPHFNGEDFDSWLTKAKYYFQVDETPSQDRIKIATPQLEGHAIQWHQGFMKSKNEVMLTWEE